MAFSQDEASTNIKTISMNMEGCADMSEEEQLAEIIEYYRTNMKDFNPAEGEITSFEALHAYMETLPGYINLSDMEEGETKFLGELDDGAKLYIKAGPSREASGE